MPTWSSTATTTRCRKAATTSSWTRANLRRTRNTRGILIGTSRTNPGKDVSEPGHLSDPKRTAQLRTVHRALTSLGVDALVSIGGDDTLKTANKFKRFQEYLPPEANGGSRWSTSPRRSTTTIAASTSRSATSRRSRPWPSEIRNLLADAEAGRMYFLVETMGRSAGWLAYGAAIAGEASLVFSVEDLVDELDDRGDAHRPQDGQSTHPQDHEHRRRRRHDRRRDDRPRDAMARSSA